MRSVVFLCLLIPFLYSALYAQTVIKEIRIVGNQKVQKELILQTIRSREGELLSRERLREDVKALYGLGFFRDVRVDVQQSPEGAILTFILLEKPTIKDLVLSGYQKVKREEIEAVLKVKKGDFFDPQPWQENLEAVRQLYASKGYYTAQVVGEVEELEGNEVILYLDISEGPRGWITEIRFEGNEVFSDSRLRRVMRTRKKNWLSWLTKAGTFNKEILDVDLARLKYFYHDHGYLDVEISEPEVRVSRDGKSLSLVLRVKEGRRYRVASVDITGDFIAPKEEILKAVKLETKPERVYRASLVEKDREKIVAYYADRGYAFCEVSPLTSRDPEKGLVHLRFEIDRGPKVHLGRITVKGNTKTVERVIRRDIKLAEGDVYKASEIRKSLRRLRRLGIFKEVNINTVPTAEEDVLDLEVKVEEMPTGALQFGGGYSSVHGVVGMVSLSEKNLFGRAISAYLRATLGAEMDEFALGVNDPRFLDTQYSLGFDLYNETYEYSTYDYRITGGDIAVGKEITDELRADLVYKYERQKVFHITEDASEYIKAQAGLTRTSKLTLSLNYWTLDNFYFPTKGWDNTLSVTNAGGPLGGDVDFVKATLSLSYFRPVWRDLVFNLRGKLGVIEEYGGKRVPLGEKFFVGGLRTIRGFEYGMAGPVDENAEPLGALKMFVLNFEFLYPLSKDLGLRAALFYDVGKGFDHWGDITPFRHAVGAGIRWYSPVGPIRIDWGYNLQRRHGEKASVWDFAVGIMY